MGLCAVSPERRFNIDLSQKSPSPTAPRKKNASSSLALGKGGVRGRDYDATTLARAARLREVAMKTHA
jgi:hypothetical protein